MLIKEVVKKPNNNTKINLIDIGSVINNLIGHGYVSTYSRREFKVRYQSFMKIDSCPNERDKKVHFNNPCNELLIWAVLMKRHAMAEFFCKRGEEILAKALVGARLNKALSRETEVYSINLNVPRDFKRYSDDFSNIAYGLLDKW
jgi:transient receptor potential cation channel subfamily M member 3